MKRCYFLMDNDVPTTPAVLRLKALIVQCSTPGVLGCMYLNTPPEDDVSLKR